MKFLCLGLGILFGLSAVGLLFMGEVAASFICSIGAALAFPKVWELIDKRREDDGKKPLPKFVYIALSIFLYVAAIAMQPDDSVISEDKTQSEIVAAKDLGIKPFELSDYFNIFVQEKDLPRFMELPSEFDVTQYEHADSFTHNISRNVAISGTIDKATQNLTDITLVFQPDGTESTMSTTILVFSGVLNAVDVEINADDMKGLIFPFLETLTKDGRSKGTVKSIKVSGNYIDNMGYFIHFSKI